MIGNIKEKSMTMIKKYMKGYIDFNKRKFQIRKVAYQRLLEKQMDIIMYKHRIELRGLLWATWIYSERRQKRWRSAVNCIKLKKLSKAMIKIKEKKEYNKKL
jgi:hypothetical protein